MEKDETVVQQNATTSRRSLNHLRIIVFEEHNISKRLYWMEDKARYSAFGISLDYVF